MSIDTPNLLLFDVAVLISVGFGFCLMSYLLPPRFGWLRLAFAPGAGAGVCAIIFFFFRRPMFGVEIGLLAVTVFLIYRQRRTIFARITVPAGSVAAFSLAVPALALAIQTLTTKSYREPHGDYDGWAIWNWEARLLYRAGAHWRDYLPSAFHGDYPLLVPATTARLWRYMGAELPDAGAWLGIVLAFCSVAVLALTLARLRSPILGVLLGLTLLGTPSFLNQSVSHYADVPLGFFFLASLALIVLYFERSDEPHSIRMLAASGFFAGCAGWTKNEGILFILAAAIAFLLPIMRQRSVGLRRLMAFGTGILAPLTVIVLFKLTNPVSNYVVAYEPGKLQRALDLARHAIILKYLGHYLFSFGTWHVSPYIPVFSFILLVGVHRPIFTSYGWLTTVTILLILAVGYYFVYLTTPVSLQWHLESSLDRLLVQLWPSFLLAAGLVCRPAGYGSD